MIVTLDLYDCVCLCVCEGWGPIKSGNSLCGYHGCESKPKIMGFVCQTRRGSGLRFSPAAKRKTTAPQLNTQKLLSIILQTNAILGKQEKTQILTSSLNVKLISPNHHIHCSILVTHQHTTSIGCVHSCCLLRVSIFY